MSRTLTASDRKRLVRLASTMETGSPMRRAILAGLSKRVTASDNREAHRLLQGIVRKTVDEWEKALGTFPLDDLSDAYNKIGGFESIADAMQNRLGEIFASHIDGEAYADFYDDLSDSGHNDLIEAYESAKHDLQQMVDAGYADEGNERYVQRRIEGDVISTLEDAIKDFKRSYGRVPRL